MESDFKIRDFEIRARLRLMKEDWELEDYIRKGKSIEDMI